MENNQSNPSSAYEQGAPMQQTIYVNAETKGNGMGTAGFVLALLPWFPGALFSFIGVFKKPKGLAIAGLVISFIGIIVIVSVIGAAAAFM